MENTEFEQRIANSPFLRVLIPPSSRPSLPRWMISDMKELESRGFNFASGIQTQPLRDPPRISTALSLGENYSSQRNVLRAIRSFITDELGIEGTDNTLRGLEIALLLGIVDYLVEANMIEKRTPEEFFVYTGLLNQQLPIFLLEITPAERQYFWQRFAEDLGVNNDWRKIYCGALAVARLAYAFNRHAEIWFPPIVYDLRLAGDNLLRTDKGLFYTQVKGRSWQEKCPLRFTLLRESPATPSPQDEWGEELVKLWAGARRFTSDTGLPVIPLAVEVNINGVQPKWEIEEYPGLLSAARNFLNGL